MSNTLPTQYNLQVLPFDKKDDFIPWIKRDEELIAQFAGSEVGSMKAFLQHGGFKSMQYVFANTQESTSTYMAESLLGTSHYLFATQQEQTNEPLVMYRTLQLGRLASANGWIQSDSGLREEISDRMAECVDLSERVYDATATASRHRLKLERTLARQTGNLALSMANIAIVDNDFNTLAERQISSKEQAIQVDTNMRQLHEETGSNPSVVQWSIITSPLFHHLEVHAEQQTYSALMGAVRHLDLVA